MTVTLTKPRPRWGVQHAGSVDRVTHVDPRENEADARRWAHALEFCGNVPVLVVDEGAGWHPAEEPTP